MSNQFSPQLIERLIRYLREQRNIEITPGEASEYLHTYAEYFLAFAEIESGRAAAGAFSAADTRTDLITPHNC